jgi:hypothetical protein
VPDVSGVVLEYTASWSYNTRFTVNFPLYLVTANDSFYVTDNIGITKFNAAFTKVKSLNSGNTYRSMFYDSANKKIAVTTWDQSKIFMFDLNLVQLSTIDITSTGAMAQGIYGYDGKYYVVLRNSKLIAIQGSTILSTFAIPCTGEWPVVQIYIDPQGVMALPCQYNNKIYLYDRSGVSLGISIDVTNPLNLAFDMENKLVVTSSTGLYRFL